MCIERKMNDDAMRIIYAALLEFLSVRQWIGGCEEEMQRRRGDSFFRLCYEWKHLSSWWTKHQVHFRRCSNSQQFKPFLRQIKINILTNDEMFYWKIGWPFVNWSQFLENFDDLSMPEFAWTLNLLCLFLSHNVALLIFVEQHQIYFELGE